PIPQDAHLWTCWGVLLMSDCYLTVTVYTFGARFRSGFRLCGAAIPALHLLFRKPRFRPTSAARKLLQLIELPCFPMADRAAVEDPRPQRKTPSCGLNGVGQTAIIFTCVFGGGDDQRGRTRVAGATGALAAGASRPGCRDLRIAAF